MLAIRKASTKLTASDVDAALGSERERLQRALDGAWEGHPLVVAGSPYFRQIEATLGELAATMTVEVDRAVVEVT